MHIYSKLTSNILLISLKKTIKVEIQQSQYPMLVSTSLSLIVSLQRVND